MQIVISQLLNPIEHSPTGGRIFHEGSMIEVTPESVTARVDSSNRYAEWYDLNRSGITIKKIAEMTGTPSGTVAYGVATHTKRLKNAGSTLSMVV